MIAGALKLCSVGICLILLLSFGLFAYDQASGASDRNLAIMTGETAVPPGHGKSPDQEQPRRFVDGAAQNLTEPVRSLMHTDSLWGIELVATIAGLLVYGLGLGYLARYAKT